MRPAPPISLDRSGGVIVTSSASFIWLWPNTRQPVQPLQVQTNRTWPLQRSRRALAIGASSVPAKPAAVTRIHPCQNRRDELNLERNHEPSATPDCC